MKTEKERERDRTEKGGEKRKETERLLVTSFGMVEKISQVKTLLEK